MAQVPRLVILDFDETLGSFSQDISTLDSLAHALNEDPALKKLPLEIKAQILQSAASQLAKHYPRPGVVEFLRTLYFLKVGSKLVKDVIVITKAQKSSEPLFAMLDIYPQKFLINGLLESASVPTRFISKIIFAPPLVSVPKNLREFKDPLWIVDDVSLNENYIFNPQQNIKDFQVSPYFGENKISTYWQRLLADILERKHGTEKFRDYYVKNLEKQIAANYEILASKKETYKTNYDSKKDEEKTMANATAALLRALNTQACKKDEDCLEKKQKCILEFCANGTPPSSRKRQVPS